LDNHFLNFLTMQIKHFFRLIHDIMPRLLLEDLQLSLSLGLNFKNENQK